MGRRPSQNVDGDGPSPLWPSTGPGTGPHRFGATVALARMDAVGTTPPPPQTRAGWPATSNHGQGVGTELPAGRGPRGTGVTSRAGGWTSRGRHRLHRRRAPDKQLAPGRERDGGGVARRPRGSASRPVCRHRGRGIADKARGGGGRPLTRLTRKRTRGREGGR